MGNKGSNHGGEAVAAPPNSDVQLDKDLDRVADQMAKNKEEKELEAKRRAKEEDRQRAELGLDNNPFGGPDGGGAPSPAAQAVVQKKKSTAQELDDVYANTRTIANETKDLTLDTLVTIDGQYEQTVAGNRKLQSINETLTEAEKNMAKMEQGMFNLSSSKNQPDLPPRGDDDVEVVFQQWKNVFTRYHHYKIRFCNGCIMRINHNQELKDTASYGQIKDMTVLQKEGFLEINFTPAVPEDKWTMYCEQEDLQAMVKEMARRKQYAGEDLHVVFAPGAPRFEYQPTVGADERKRQFGMDKSGGSKGRAHAGGTKLSNMQNTHDAFLDDMLNNLDTIGDMNQELGHTLDRHVTELQKQQELVKETDDRTKRLNKRADDWLAKNG